MWLINFLKDNNQYKFMKIHEAWGKLSPLEDLSELGNGDVIIAYLPNKHSSDMFTQDNKLVSHLSH